MTELGRVGNGTSISGVFQRFCKSARSPSRQRENFMDTYLLIIWAEKIIPLTMKSIEKPYPLIVFLSTICIFSQVHRFRLNMHKCVKTFLQRSETSHS